MKLILEKWTETGVMRALVERKAIFEESQDDNVSGQLPPGYSDAATTGQGALLFCVQRGRMSEGIDFRDELARAVVCIGIPYANTSDPQIWLKRGFNTKHKAELGLVDGSQWYANQAYRSLNQSAGRVLRHGQDWGAIIFLESRLKLEVEFDRLSPWIQSKAKTYADIMTARTSLESFFTDRDATALSYSQSSSDL